jgi:Mrp family chromosome partitioning ATPase
MRIPNVDPVITQLAEAPSRPTDPNIAVYVMLGISIGFLVGVTGVALFRRRRLVTDERMVSEAGGQPVLAVLGGEADEREQEWNLAALAVERSLPRDRPVIVAVTAADGDAGESAAATNELAAALARSGSVVSSMGTVAGMGQSADIVVVDASNMLRGNDIADEDDALGNANAHAVVIVVPGRVRENELRSALDRLKAQRISILGAVLTPGIRSAKSGVLQLISSNRRSAE